MARSVGPHTHLGHGGRLVEPQSESGELSYALSVLGSLYREDIPRSHRQMLASVIARLEALKNQVSAGYHRNPALMVHLNPGIRAPHPMGTMGRFEAGKAVGLMSKDVHEIRYTHADDGKAYKHVFETPTEMWAILRAGHHDILISHANGDPVWRDF